MKPRPILVVALLTLLVGCSRDESRYELVRVEKGVIRLDRATGEVVAINDYNTVSLIDISSHKENAEIDPVLSVVKAFPDFKLPGANNALTVHIEYRWLRAQMDYRITLSPFIEKLHIPIHDDGNSLSIILHDSDDFEVQRFEFPFKELVRVAGEGDKIKEWRVTGSIHISKSDFKRIVGTSYTWRYSDAFEAALTAQ